MADIPAGGGSLPKMPGLVTPHRVFDSGFRISGDVGGGYRLTIPYYVRWNDAYQFVDELFRVSTAASVGGAITYTPGHKVPFVEADLYARTFELEPMGVAEDAAAGTYLGLSAAEDYYAYAKVVVTYQTPDEAQAAGEAPLHQLDPANPLTVCRQSVRASGKMETAKGGSYVYVSDNKPVKADFALPTCESVLDLEFPEVPYLPWQLVRPYINKINSAPMLGVGAGELLLEGMSTRVEYTTQGMAQSIVLSFAVAPTPGVTWNHLPRDGVPVLVKRKGSSDGIYLSADFTDIFDALDRS